MRTIQRLAAVTVALLASTVYAEPTVSSEARALLDQVRDGYAKLKTVKLDSTLAAQFDVAGETFTQSVVVASSADAAGRFVCRVGEEMTLTSDGTKTYVFSVKPNAYTESTAPKARVAVGDLPEGLADLVGGQDLSLLLTIVDDAAKALSADYEEINLGSDEMIDGKSFATLALKRDGIDVKILVDPATGLLRRVSADHRRGIEASGATGVVKAEVTTDYTAVTPDAELAQDAFAWAPPRDARLAENGPTELMAGDNTDGAQQLVGKPAPDFTLEDLEGKPVKLADFKGKVVILDFWATWCGPCVAGMPHLDALRAKHEKDDLVVLAVNQQEEKAQVKKFLESKKLGLKAVLDTDGKVAGKYAVTGIPQTVLIGKDGKVVKVQVGFNEASVDALDGEVEKALK